MDRLPFKHINPSLTSAAIRRAGAPMRRPWAVLEPLTPLLSFPAGLLGLWESPISGSGRKLCHIMSRWDEKAHFNYIQQKTETAKTEKGVFSPFSFWITLVAWRPPQFILSLSESLLFSAHASSAPATASLLLVLKALPNPALGDITFWSLFLQNMKVL